MWLKQEIYFIYLFLNWTLASIWYHLTEKCIWTMTRLHLYSNVFSIFLVHFQSCWSCHPWSAAIQSTSSSPWRKNSLGLQEPMSSTAPNSKGLPHTMGYTLYALWIHLHPRFSLVWIYLYHLCLVFLYTVSFLFCFIMKYCKCWIMADTFSKM